MVQNKIKERRRDCYYQLRILYFNYERLLFQFYISVLKTTCTHISYTLAEIKGQSIYIITVILNLSCNLGYTIKTFCENDLIIICTITKY